MKAVSPQHGGLDSVVLLPKCDEGQGSFDEDGQFQ
jgi:hypothetical protein